MVLHRGFATRSWAIFTISFQDVADFLSEYVEQPLWRYTPRRPVLLFRNKIRLTPRSKPNFPQTLERFWFKFGH
ncbi:hypothetical protein EDF68_101848 [Ochrobactrum sp. BH3]|nr:hypothetical protein EDF68_101848 [Ochrobactrum sp. BH3]